MLQEVHQEMIRRAKELLHAGNVARMLGWRRGDFDTLTEPAVFTTCDEVDNLVYDKFCVANLSKYLIELSKQDGVTLAFLRPCDTFSFNQLVKERQVTRDKVHVIGVPCEGCVAVDELEEGDMFEKCLVCDKTEHAVYDETINGETTREDKDRFSGVIEVEALTADEKFDFWQKELGRCIRCNACRNVCSVCHCKNCVFDNDKYDTKQRANADSFEEQMFHIIRAYHVAGRCTDCGQCSRVCPQKIQLQLLNRKFIKDINEFYGEYQAGADAESVGPLTSFDISGDREVRE